MSVSSTRVWAETARQDHARSARQARSHRAEFTRLDQGADAEDALASALRPLEGRGWHLLADRRWPGSTRAQVDFVLLGPAGVFLIDAKAWTNPRIDDGRLFCGSHDATDEVTQWVELASQTTDALAASGVARLQVHPLLVLVGASVEGSVRGGRILGSDQLLEEISSYSGSLTPETVVRVQEALDARFPPYFDDEDAAPPPARHLSPVEVEQPSLFSVEQLDELQIARGVTLRLEEWMTFIHPDQARFVTRRYSGPSRLRGAAGTGKTVVGLHRAVELARGSTGRVLVTTYARTLARTLEQLVARMAPDVAGRIDVRTVHALATGLLRDRAVRYRLEPTASDLAFTRAWARTHAQTRLIDVVPDLTYWRDEVRHVIKGRCLPDLESYIAVDRIGRRTPLQQVHRERVWTLFQAYWIELHNSRVHDFEDVIDLALAAVRSAPCDRWEHVVVDEAQDLSGQMVRLIHTLVGDRPDGLTLIGDGQQSVYPGGYRLTECGVSVQGRGATLRANYRNTAEIAELAMTLRDDTLVDFEGRSIGAGTPPPERRGRPTMVISASSVSEHDARLGEHVATLLQHGATPGDIAVLSSSASTAKRLCSALAGLGVGVLPLDEYVGRPVDAVKIGTLRRAKGLEFSHVLLAQVDPDVLEGRGDDETSTLLRNQLYVGVTRARDSIWVGTLSRRPQSGMPSR